ncbi:hypothetical protein J6590_008079 [Homalodisca vitripennis]|nr:hypothetical protein J6590_008079 [Homalodisca vitripennis]
MVRETRHLWVGNLPENIREDRIRDHFKRHKGGKKHKGDGEQLPLPLATHEPTCSHTTKTRPDLRYALLRPSRRSTLRRAGRLSPAVTSFEKCDLPLPWA